MQLGNAINHLLQLSSLKNKIKIHGQHTWFCGMFTSTKIPPPHEFSQEMGVVGPAGARARFIIICFC